MIIYIEPWMRHYEDKLRDLQLGRAPTVEMRGEVYGLCGGCRRVIKLSGFWGGVHFC